MAKFSLDTCKGFNCIPVSDLGMYAHVVIDALRAADPKIVIKYATAKGNKRLLVFKWSDDFLKTNGRPAVFGLLLSKDEKSYSTYTHLYAGAWNDDKRRLEDVRLSDRYQIVRHVNQQRFYSSEKFNYAEVSFLYGANCKYIVKGENGKASITVKAIENAA